MRGAIKTRFTNVTDHHLQGWLLPHPTSPIHALSCWLLFSLSFPLSKRPPKYQQSYKTHTTYPLPPSLSVRFTLTTSWVGWWRCVSSFSEIWTMPTTFHLGMRKKLRRIVVFVLVSIYWLIGNGGWWLGLA